METLRGVCLLLVVWVVSADLCKLMLWVLGDAVRMCAIECGTAKGVVFVSVGKSNRVRRVS